MVMPFLLLQKPSRTSKSKDHNAALKRRMDLWENGDIQELMEESETIQRNLKSLGGKKSIEEISKQFIEKMSQGNVNGAIKLLTNKMENGILPLNEETLKMLRQKHPEPKDAPQDVLLNDEVPSVHSIRFEKINGELIRKVALKTRGGAGPSGLDGDGWKRLLTSNSFEKESSDLCAALATLTRLLCTNVQASTSLEALMACRLIPLNKNPGLRPIGVGEVLRRIIGKSVANVLKSDVKHSVGSLQVCAGQDAGCEAAVHAIHRIFDQEESEAVLLVDASNAFNSVNRKVFLHNVKVICPSISTFVENCYQAPSRLFVIGGVELKSSERTTQGDPIAMMIYAITIIPLILRTVDSVVASNEPNTKAAGYADDLFGAGSIEGLHKMWTFIRNEGPKYEYYQEATKSWLIVKKTSLEKATQIFAHTDIQITTEGRKHLGAIVGSEEYRDLYIDEKITGWIDEICTLSKIAQHAPQQAYTCFTAGYKHKLNYCMRTIGNIGPALRKVDDVVTTLLIPAITGGIIPTTAERRLFSLPPSMGGLGIPIFEDFSVAAYENSTNVTMMLQDAIIAQKRQYDIDEKKLSAAKGEMKKRILSRNKDIFDKIYVESTERRRKLLEIISKKGASLWLTTLPIKEEGFQFDKQTFWDLMRIRYGYQLTRLPEKCACGAHFDLQHALSCKKSGFVTLRHNMIRDVTARLLKEVCHDVRVEPQLLPITGEDLKKSNSQQIK